MTLLQGFRTTAVQFVSTLAAAVSNFLGWWRTGLDTHPHPHTQDKTSWQLFLLTSFTWASSDFSSASAVSIAVASATLKTNGTYRDVGVSVCLDADCSAGLDEHTQWAGKPPVSNAWTVNHTLWRKARKQEMVMGIENARHSPWGSRWHTGQKEGQVLSSELAQLHRGTWENVCLTFYRWWLPVCLWDQGVKPELKACLSGGISIHLFWKIWKPITLTQ